MWGPRLRSNLSPRGDATNDEKGVGMWGEKRTLFSPQMEIGASLDRAPPLAMSLVEETSVIGARQKNESETRNHQFQPS